jgi:hypothetical protein
MSTCIVLPDGRMRWASNWAYDSVIWGIADQLDRHPEGGGLAAWLRDQACFEQGPGIGTVDIRELTPRNQQLFRWGARLAFRRAILDGPAGWHDLTRFPAWLAGFQRLLRMWKAVDRREPPGLLGELQAVRDPTGVRSGPGWDGPGAG